MSNIVYRLRLRGKELQRLLGLGIGKIYVALCDEAADEITRLRAEIERKDAALAKAHLHARACFDDRPRLPDNIYWTDGYDAGTRAAERAVEAFTRQALEPRI